MPKKLWGGRFNKEKIDEQVLDFTSSLDIDKVLIKHDCISSKVQAEMLAKCGYMDSDEKNLIIEAIDGLLESVEKGKIQFSGYEDIHSLVQAYVAEKAPDASKKLHTGRSRNEQVVNDVRLYCKEKIDEAIHLCNMVQGSIVELAEDNIEVLIPGYTHLNHAQPVLFAHLLMGYVEMLGRDSERLQDAKKRCDTCVMGSGALAGSALELNRKFVAEKLGFAKVSNNSIDSVSDRDFIVEILSSLSIIAMHLSRMSEDLVLYSISEFGFVDIGEDYCTGSSLMPQKKNADVLELIRGKSSIVIGALNSMLILLKGLPHAYNRDLQDDKKFLFESFDIISSELHIMSNLIKTIKVDKEATLSQLDDEFIYATDIAEYLVKKNISFQEAHWIVGNIVKYCLDKKINISDLSVPELKGFSEKLEDDIYGYLNPEKSVKNKKTYGSTNPDEVKKQIADWKKKLKK